MKTRTAVKTAAVALALASSLMLFSGCGKKIYSDPNMTTTIPQTSSPGDIAYSELSVSLSKYDAALNEYMHTHRSECTTKEVDDKTMGGIACHSVFTVSPDNKYRILQQEKKYDDKTVMDEYFDLGEALFIARTTVYKNGTFDPVEKYYITNNIVYKLDFNAQTIYKVVDIGSETAATTQKTLDLYFSFNDIMAKYG